MRPVNGLRRRPVVQAVRVDLQPPRGPIGVEYVNAAVSAEAVRPRRLVGGVAPPLAGGVVERDRRRVVLIILVVKSNAILP